MTPIMFRPKKKYLTKILLEASLLSVFIVASTGLLGYLIGKNKLGGSMGTVGFLVGLLVNLIWIIPSILIIVRYYQSLHYEIHEDEVIMHVGVITKTVKHVPFRAITNLKVKRGPFDRLLGLGTIDIQTAGKSGESDPEESLVGLGDYRKVYDQVAKSIRNFESTNISRLTQEQTPALKTEELEEMLIEIRSIRQILGKQ